MNKRRTKSWELPPKEIEIVINTETGKWSIVGDKDRIAKHDHIAIRKLAFAGIDKLTRDVQRILNDFRPGITAEFSMLGVHYDAKRDYLEAMLSENEPSETEEDND